MSRIDSYGRFCSRQCSGRWHTGRRNGWYRSGLCFNRRIGRWVIDGRDGSRTYFYRAVMEAKLGRELTPDEVIHHVDGDRTNDDPANLELMTQRTHSRLHNPLQPEKPHSRAHLR